MSKFQKFAIILTAFMFFFLGFQAYSNQEGETSPQPTKTVNPSPEPTPMEIEDGVIETVSIEPIVAYSGVEEETINWNDILFIGDSLTVGLNTECGLENLGSTVDAEVGRRIDEGINAAERHSGFKAVVITIGTNSFGMENDLFAETYQKIIDKVKENNPESTVYVNTIPPCEENKARNYGYYIGNDALDEKNEIIRSLENVIVLDLNKELKDNGYETMDGIHLKNSSYNIWFEFLKENLNIEEEKD